MQKSWKEHFSSELSEYTVNCIYHIWFQKRYRLIQTLQPFMTTTLSSPLSHPISTLVLVGGHHLWSLHYTQQWDLKELNYSLILLIRLIKTLDKNCFFLFRKNLIIESGYRRHGVDNLICCWLVVFVLLPTLRHLTFIILGRGQGYLHSA